MHARVPAPRSDYPFLDSLTNGVLGNPLAYTRIPRRYRDVEELEKPVEACPLRTKHGGRL
jgi:hypothetical protein